MFGNKKRLESRVVELELRIEELDDTRGKVCDLLKKEIIDIVCAEQKIALGRANVAKSNYLRGRKESFQEIRNRIIENNFVL